MGKKTKKTRIIGIIQCDFAKERCSGFRCVHSFHEREDAFADYPAKEGGCKIICVNENREV